MVGGLTVVPTHKKDGEVPEGGVGLFVNGPVVTCSVRTTVSSKVFSGVVISASSVRVTRITGFCNTRIPFLESRLASSSCSAAISILLRIVCRCRALGVFFSGTYYVCSATPFIAYSGLQTTLGLRARGSCSSIFDAMRCSCPVRETLGGRKRGVTVL